ncbi:MAG: hypothetical protein KJP06_03245, partial [Deltaproteobacteria bacterium]|nr:hypothetical protein [Deltaproteobacteria bacterium]
MPNTKTTLCLLFWIGLVVATLMGCGAKGQPAEFEQTAGEMKKGPGVLTGEEGALVVYDSKRGGAFPQFRENKSKEGSTEASEKAGKDASAVSETATESSQIAVGQTT